MSKPAGIWVDTVHSVRDFGRCYANREVAAPTKRTNRKTIPYKNGSIDFTNLYGEPFYEDRTLVYTFEVIGETPFQVSKDVEDFIEWLLELTAIELHDDEMPAWHWRGSCDAAEIAYEDGYGLKATITATFTVYPFKIADEYSSAQVSVGDNEILNEGRKARMTVIPDGTVTIQVGPVRQTFTGETEADIYLPHGYSTVTVTDGSAVIRWHEERL